MTNIHRQIGLVLLTLLACLLAGTAQATPIVFEGTGTNPNSGQGLDAQASFDTAGNNLIVTLTNNGADVLDPTDVLTAVFFDLAGNPGLGSSSAVLAPGSTVLFGTTDPGGVVGGEWGYSSTLSGAPQGAHQGISSSGFGLFGLPTFPGSNLQGPTALDGIQYGITSVNDNPGTGNAPVTGANALIKNSVVFTLSGLPGLFDPRADVRNVFFQYGTELTDVGLPGHPVGPIPEPASILLLGLGLTGVGGVGWLRRRRPDARSR